MNDLDLTKPGFAGVSRRSTFLHACLFIAGFSLIFIVGWGGAATLFGSVFTAYKPILARIGGLVVILFGLSTLGVVRLPWRFYADTRPQIQLIQKRSAWASSMLMGIIFAAGWTPCIGTTLGAILTLGFSQESADQAMLLSSGYALGLGIPFLILGAGLDRALRFFSRFRRYARTIQIVNGAFLILIGLLLFFGQMYQISIWAQRNGWYVDLPLGASTTPTYLLAIAAGLLSFFSPCVLPLVPAYLGYLGGRASLFDQVGKPDPSVVIPPAGEPVEVEGG